MVVEHLVILRSLARRILRGDRLMTLPCKRGCGKPGKTHSRTTLTIAMKKVGTLSEMKMALSVWKGGREELGQASCHPRATRRENIMERKSWENFIRTRIHPLMKMGKNGPKVDTKGIGMASPMKITQEKVILLVEMMSGLFLQKENQPVMSPARRRHLARGKTSLAIKFLYRAFVGGVLCMGTVARTFASDPSLTPEEKPTMENAASMADNVEQAKALALQTVHTQLSPDYEYATTVKDTGDSFEVLILPKGRVRGGGAKVIVSKQSMTVVKTYFLQ